MNLEEKKVLITETYRICYNKLVRSIANLLDIQTCEDIVQDAYLKAIKKIDLFDGRKPVGWLLRIVATTAINYTRSANARITRPGNNPWEHEPYNTTPEDLYLEVESERIYRGAVKTAKKGLQNLNPNHRKIFTEVDLNNLTYKDAAKKLKIPEGTVMSGLHRTRKKLRTVLKEKHPELEERLAE